MDLRYPSGIAIRFIGKAKKRFRTKRRYPIFYFYRRFSGEKNPELLIRAFKQIGAKQVGLIMLGEGPLWEDLKKRR